MEKGTCLSFRDFNVRVEVDYSSSFAALYKSLKQKVNLEPNKPLEGLVGLYPLNKLPKALHRAGKL